MRTEMKKLIAICLTTTAFLIGCEKAPDVSNHQRQHIDTSVVPIYQYKGDDDLYTYIMYTNMVSNSCPCYTYSSATPVTNFSDVRFNPAPTAPMFTAPSTNGGNISTGGINLSKVGSSNDLSKDQQQEVENEAELVTEQAEEISEPETEATASEATSDSSTQESAANTSSSDAGSADSGGGDGGGE